MLLILLSMTTAATLAVLGCGGGSGPKDEPPNRAESNSCSQQAPKPKIEPKRGELNKKEAMIKEGLKTGKNAYPTIEDVKSDWSDRDDEKKKGEGGKEKKSKMAKPAPSPNPSENDSKPTSKEKVVPEGGESKQKEVAANKSAM